MAVFIWAHGPMIKLMDSEDLELKLAQLLQVSGLMMCRRAWEQKRWLMEASTKACTREAKDMALVSLFGMTAQSMKDSGKTI